jgi:PAS domain S-box-containing protein
MGFIRGFAGHARRGGSLKDLEDRSARMPATPSPIARRFTEFSAITGLVVPTISVLVLIGWTFGSPLLQSFVPGWEAMPASTAIALLFGGASLRCLVGSRERWAALAAIAGGLIVASMGAATLIDHLIGIEPSVGGRFLPGAPMTVTTASGLLLIGTSLVILVVGGGPLIGQALAASAALLALLGALGSVLRADAVFGVEGFYAAMAPLTSLTLLLLGLGAMCALPDRGPMAVAIDGGAAGTVMRRILPAAVLLLVVLDSAWTVAERLGWFPAGLGIPALVTSNVAIITALIWRVADSLRTREDQFRNILDTNLDAIAIRSLRRGTFVRVNDEFERFTGYDRSEIIGQAPSPLGLWASGAGRGGSQPGGPVRNVEVRFRTKSGEVRVGLVSEALIRFGGEPAIMSFVRDITQRTLAEENFRALLESAPDAMVIVDEKGAIVLVNAQTERFFGYQRGELLGQPAELLIPERYRPGHGERRSSVFAAPQAAPMGAGFELHGQRRDGSEFPVEISSSPLRTEQGVLVSSAIRDVTERKRAEEKFRALLESAPDAMVIVDERGTIVLVNAQTERLFGYQRGELLGQSAELLIPERYRPRGGERRSRVFADPQAGPMATGFELYGLRRDGSEFPVEISSSPLRTEEGVLVSSALRDISERKRAEVQILRLATLVESSDDAILAEDLDGTIVSWNRGAEELYGYRADEIEGRNVSRLFPAELAEECTSILQRMRRGERIEHHDTLRLRKDGTSVAVSMTISPMRDAGGRLFGASCIARDISARRRAEAEQLRQAKELERSNAELEQFAYVSSHDLQEPLRMVATYVQLLEEEYRGKLGVDADEYIHFARDGAVRMQQLIDNLLEYSRLGQHRRPFERVDCGKIVDQTIRHLKPIIDESGAVITRGPLPEVLGDPSELGQLFQNLLSNAIKFHGSAPPRVEVEAERVGDEWKLWVRDHGIGIAPEHFDRIFRIFQRLHARSEYPGTGIGLAICRKVVENHGGTMWVESKPQAGATFCFTLPVAATSVTAARESQDSMEVPDRAAVGRRSAAGSRG